MLVVICVCFVVRAAVSAISRSLLQRSPTGSACLIVRDLEILTNRRTDFGCRAEYVKSVWIMFVFPVAAYC